MPISAIVTRCANLGDFCNKLSKKRTWSKQQQKQKNYKGKGCLRKWNSIGKPWLISIRFRTTKRTKVVNKGWASFVVNLRVLKGICGVVNPFFANLGNPFILALLCSPWPLTQKPLFKVKCLGYALCSLLVRGKKPSRDWVAGLKSIGYQLPKASGELGKIPKWWSVIICKKKRKCTHTHP